MYEILYNHQVKLYIWSWDLLNIILRVWAYKSVIYDISKVFSMYINTILLIKWWCSTISGPEKPLVYTLTTLYYVYHFNIEYGVEICQHLSLYCYICWQCTVLWKKYTFESLFIYIEYLRHTFVYLHNSFFPHNSDTFVKNTFLLY